jgi:hypothetical protein
VDRDAPSNDEPEWVSLSTDELLKIVAPKGEPRKVAVVECVLEMIAARQSGEEFEIDSAVLAILDARLPLIDGKGALQRRAALLWYVTWTRDYRHLRGCDLSDYYETDPEALEISDVAVASLTACAEACEIAAALADQEAALAMLRSSERQTILSSKLGSLVRVSKLVEQRRPARARRVRSKSAAARRQALAPRVLHLRSEHPKWTANAIGDAIIREKRIAKKDESTLKSDVRLILERAAKASSEFVKPEISVNTGQS